MVIYANQELKIIDSGYFKLLIVNKLLY